MPTATAQNELTLACNVYGLLCYVPPEYFARPVRAELIKRAMAGDVQICAVLASTEGQRSRSRSKSMVRGDTKLRSRSPMDESDDKVPLEGTRSWLRRLTFVRAFLQRMGQFLNTANYSVSFMFFPPTMLMQDMHEDLLGFCHPSAQSFMHIFPFKSTHECHAGIDPITHCVGSALLSLPTLIMVSISGASYAHKSQRREHPFPVSFLWL